jgi:hypothetical protein
MANTKTPQTAETVLGLIDSLPPAERTKLFKLLVGHPDNIPIKECHELVVAGRRLWEARLEADSLRRVLDDFDRAKKHRDALRESHSFGEYAIKVAEELMQAESEMARVKEAYTRGPERKKARAAKLKNAIRDALAGGTPRNAKAVLAALKLRDDASELLSRNRNGEAKQIGVKTIANLLSLID